MVAPTCHSSYLGGQGQGGLSLQRKRKVSWVRTLSQTKTMIKRLEMQLR